MSDGDGEIVVDLNGLRAVGDDIATRTSQTLSAHASYLKRAFRSPVPFGEKWPGTTVADATQRVRESMVQAIDTVDRYVAAVDTLAAAAKTIADRYEHADSHAAMRGQDVDKVLTDAYAAAQAALAAPRKYVGMGPYVQ